MIRAFPLASARLAEILEFAFTLPGLGWSFVNLSSSDPGVGELLELAQSKMLEAGREVDSRLRGGEEVIFGEACPW